LSALLDRLDPDKNQNYQTLISALLLEEIEKFDRQIGEAVITLCKKPKKLTEGQAQELVQKHSEVLSRAYHGTTLTIALVNRSQEAMWLAGVGDSTVGKCGLIELPDFDLSLPMHFEYH
jgi:pyruvate dehydrogenase phosphatase